MTKKAPRVFCQDNVKKNTTDGQTTNQCTAIWSISSVSGELTFEEKHFYSINFI